MMSFKHQVHDKVYIRDDIFEWLPAIVLEVESNRALVAIQLPYDWDETTVVPLSGVMKSSLSDRSKSTSPSLSYDQLNLQHRWVYFRDYLNGKLPLQNRKTSCRDIVTDLENSYMHEAEILYQIKFRYTSSSQNPYTRVGTIGLIAINTNVSNDNNAGRSIGSNSMYSVERQRAYGKRYVSVLSSENNATLEEKKECDTSYCRDDDLLMYEPHVYEISSIAFKNMIRKKQAIIVSGESGSGKTETSKIIIQHLVALPQLLRSDIKLDKTSMTSNNSSSNSNAKDDDNLSKYIVEGIQVVEAFGNAKTNHHPNSSRFGKVIQLQYSSSRGNETTATNPNTQTNVCTITGTTVHTYLIEASRVVSTTCRSDGERNFHIFYQLLSSSSTTKQALLGHNWANARCQDFKYLSCVSNSDNEQHYDHQSKAWKNTMKSMKLFCWDDSSIKMLMQGIGVILRLGNITFDSNWNGEAVISSKDELKLLSGEMGLSITDIEKALTGKRIATNAAGQQPETIRVEYTVDDANAARDALAKAVYVSLFSSVVRHINLLTSSACNGGGSSNIKPKNPTTGGHVLSVVDVFGFDNSLIEGENSFQQFSTNYVNELLQQKYLHDILSKYKIEYDREGIDLPDWREIDNNSTIQLLEGPNGILPALNRQNTSLIGNSEMFLFEVRNSNSNHEKLIHHNEHKAAQFTVRHFAGPVTYDGSNFVEQNKDDLPEGLLSLASKCSNPLISQELGKVIAIQSYKTILGQNDVNVPSTTVDKVRKQLQDLMKSIDNHETRYIRCMKPSERPNERRKIEHCTVLRQLRSSGFVVAVNLSRNVFPQKLPFVIVEQKFSCLIDNDSQKNMMEMEMQDRVQIMMSILFAPIIEKFKDSEFRMPFVCGKTRVFFREGALELLESRRQDCLNVLVIRLQRWIRQQLARVKFSTVITGIVKLQTIERRRPIYRKYQTERTSALRIQVLIKTLSAKKRFQKNRDCILVLQKWFRLLLVRKNMNRLSHAATKIAKWRRSQTHRNASSQRRWLSTMAPIYLTSMKDLKCFDAKKRQKLFKAIQASNGLFSHKIPFQLLEERFVCLIPEVSQKAMAGMRDNDKAQLMMLILFAPYIDQCREHKNFPMPFACGRSRVYFRAGSLEILEIIRREHYTFAILRLQHWARGVAVQRNYCAKRNSIVRIQERFRARAAKNMTLGVSSFIHALGELGYLKPAYKAALIKARSNATKIFPYILAYSVAIDRFESMMSRKQTKAIRDMDPLDKSQFIMSILFTPILEGCGDKNMPMPFSCREEGVYLRVGSLEVLEILRKEKIRRNVIKIQSMIRKTLAMRRSRNLTLAAVRLQCVCRGTIGRRKYDIQRESARVLQIWVRAVRLRLIAKLKAAKTIESITRVYLARLELSRRRGSATILTSWARSLLLKIENAHVELGDEGIQVSTLTEMTPTQSSKITENLFKLSLPSITSQQLLEEGNVEEKANGTCAHGQSKHNSICAKLLGDESQFSSCYVNDPSMEKNRVPPTSAHTNIAEKLPEATTSDMLFFEEHVTDRPQPGARLQIADSPHQRLLDGDPQATLCRALLEEEGSPASHESERDHRDAHTTKDAIMGESEEGGTRNLDIPENYKQCREFADESCLPKRPSLLAYSAERSITATVPPESDLKNKCDKLVVSTKQTADEVEAAVCAERGVEGDHGSLRLPLLEKERYYKEQVEVLRNDIIQVTTDAEIHNQEMEAEYEDRLSAYETEVLQLQHNVETLETENAVLKKKLILMQERYEETIKNLKETMKKTEDSHRKYLEQVMASVEKSKAENANSLEVITNGRDSRIRDLEDVIAKLQEEQAKNQVHSGSHGQSAEQELRRLAQKVEKIVSAQHITKLHDQFRHEPRRLKAAIEEKVSYKVRNIVGRMERMLVMATSSSPQLINVITDEKEMKQLEQQLVHAYEEIETLENELNSYRGSKNRGATGVRRLTFF